MSTLTREQVLAMPAGEDLDCLIAERVLGWTGCFEGLRAVREADPSQPCAAEILTGLPPFASMHRPVPRYSTAIAAAWEVVEHCRAQWRTDDPGGLFWRFTDCDEQGWGASVCWAHHDGDIDMETVVAETLPLAICRCALLRWLTEAE